ncbi:hypothetical protein V6N12_024734 [Hibiscus sabdariffa]|uniref:Uncharacterized protein n=1 Tax=Hibiscus sabdariffa TaxID=183260 RepID=A0ABR2BFT5_9ROSI
MEPLRKQRNPYLIKDPNTFLGVSISSAEIWKHEKVNTDENIVDPLTKPLAQQNHDRHTESLGIRYAAAFRRRGSAANGGARPASWADVGES